MPYLSQLDLTRARPYSGLGQGPTGDPRAGTAAEWEAYYSRKSWERKAVMYGPRTGEWQKQATWAAMALQKLIAGESVTVRPFPTDPELLALIVNGRAWLLTLPEWELNDLFPGLTPEILAQARRILLPGQNVVGIARTKLQSDLERLGKDYKRMVDLRAELQRYLVFAQDTMAVFQHYVRWFQHHERKKAKRTQQVAAALTAVSSVLYFVPVVGWALGLIVDAVNIAWQMDRMKKAIEAMQAAGLRVEGARLYVAVMEALAQAIAEVEQARDEAEWMLMLTQEQLSLLDQLGPIPGTPTAVPDTAIAGALRGEAGRGVRGAIGKVLLVGAVVLAGVLALFGRKRRA